MVYDDVSKIYDFAKSNGYNITAFSVADRRNSKGAYSVAELTIVIPRESKNEKTQKDEVRTYEV